MSFWEKKADIVSGLPFIDSDTKQRLVYTRTHFMVTYCEYYENGNYGPQWNITIAFLDKDVSDYGESGIISFKSSVARDKIFNMMQEYISDNGPVESILIKRRLPNGQSYFDIAEPDNL